MCICWCTAGHKPNWEIHVSSCCQLPACMQPSAGQVPLSAQAAPLHMPEGLHHPRPNDTASGCQHLMPSHSKDSTPDK